MIRNGNDMEELFAVILAGGKGTRFWPLSRARRPKQLIDITGRGSMLRLTFERLAAFVPPERIILLTTEDLGPSIGNELPEIGEANIFLEPVGRNTGPSLAVASAIVSRHGGDAPMLCCPADHLIDDEEEFRDLVGMAARVVRERDALVTFGIKPDGPETGYGYIEAGEKAEERKGRSFFEVVRFHEKPDLEKARNYVMDESFYWNSGIFLWRPSVFRSAWERFVPESVAPLDEISRALGTASMKETVAAVYPQLPSVSVDYAVLEKAENVLVAPASLNWSDVGSWDALFDILPVDDAGNIGVGYVKTLDSKRNLLFNPGGTTAAVGVEDVIVVVDGNDVLVCRRGQSQMVRDMLEKMAKDGRTDLL
jgi:mannose-1-phosphate guanylyltransferase